MIRLPLLVSVSGLAAFVVLPIFACTTVIDAPNVNPDGDGGMTGDDGATTGDAGDMDASSDVGVDAGPFIPAKHPAYPQVPHIGSGVLSAMKLVTITAPGDPNAATYASFGTSLVGSNWYSTIAKDYGLGVPTSAGTFAGSSLSGVPSLSAGQMQSYIANAISGSAAAAPDGHHMYIVFLPPGTGESNDPTCQQYGGYHQQYGGGGDGWGFVQHCTNPPGLTQLQWMTTAASHEIIEAATDTGQGWQFPQPDPSQTVWTTLLAEVGDLCVGTQIAEGLFTYQRVWMNSLAASAADPCGPKATKAYFNAAPPAGVGGLGWFSVAAGANVALPVTGFSTARIGDWVIDAAVTKADCGGAACAPGDFTVAVTSPTNTTISGKMYPTINNGVVASLTITAKATVPSGSFAEIQLVSEALTAGSDPYHVWPVGVYVP